MLPCSAVLGAKVLTDGSGLCKPSSRAGKCLPTHLHMQARPGIGRKMIHLLFQVKSSKAVCLQGAESRQGEHQPLASHGAEQQELLHLRLSGQQVSCQPGNQTFLNILILVHLCTYIFSGGACCQTHGSPALPASLLPCPARGDTGRTLAQALRGFL